MDHAVVVCDTFNASWNLCFNLWLRESVSWHNKAEGALEVYSVRNKLRFHRWIFRRKQSSPISLLATKCSELRILCETTWHVKAWLRSVAQSPLPSLLRKILFLSPGPQRAIRFSNLIDSDSFDVNESGRSWRAFLLDLKKSWKLLSDKKSLVQSTTESLIIVTHWARYAISAVSCIVLCSNICPALKSVSSNGTWKHNVYTLQTSLRNTCRWTAEQTIS